RDHLGGAFEQTERGLLAPRGAGDELGEVLGDARAGQLHAELERLADDGSRSRDGLHAALRAAPAQGSVDVDAHVPDLPRVRARTPVDRAVDEHARADARAEEEGPE